jgi:2-polyprenyl-6-methoxyphenol hydroxylase-like FAD-dependent oxidoreductase
MPWEERRLIEVPVLIVGGGPVGLTASMLLSQHGIRSLLVERHPGTAIVPKARGINARTMEMYRQIGVEDAIRSAGLPPQATGLTVWTESLAGVEIERRVPGRATPKNMLASPMLNCLCAQDDLEPVLRRFAEAQQRGELRFNAELSSVTQDEHGVDAVLTDRVTGDTTKVRAGYVIAADGAKSAIRRMLNVRMIGRERVYDSVNIVFNADLRPWTADRPAALYFVEQPDLRATFLTINARDRWGFLIHSVQQYGWQPEDFTPEHCAALVRQGVGVPDLPVTVLGAVFWEASAHVAETYCHGRIFLAGDAAHEMPPTGGFGMNTGVQDVHNLAWKLAAVLHGDAGPALLQTYHAERQPLGALTTQVSLDNSLSMGRTTRQSAAKLPRTEFLSEQGLIFGVCYESAAVVSDGTPVPDLARSITEYVPSARPGRRAPHVWLRRDGQRVSTIDLFGRGFVLLTGGSGRGWQQAASRIEPSLHLPLQVQVIGGEGTLQDEAGGAWTQAYDIEDDGAVLVRPDGYVAWRVRAAPGDPEAELRDVFDRLLDRGSR